MLRDLTDTVAKHIIKSLELLGELVNMWNSLVIYVPIDKLDKAVRE